ncbi:MAG: hypothetical protein ABIQ59_15350 [Nocardioidaceae bacterium]
MDDHLWRLLAARQSGLVTREQLHLLGVDRHRVRNQLRAERWREVSPTVLGTTTGALTFEQRLWAGVLHAGPPAAVGGLTAAGVHGLRNWPRDEVTVVVPKSDTLPSLSGVHFVETRRDIAVMTASLPGAPCLALEPALLLFAAYTRSERTAAGVLAAAVQQQLTTPAALDAWLPRMRPLRRSRMFAALLVDLTGGAQSVAELDVGKLCRRGGLVAPNRQVLRRDRQGRRRYTDCEWTLAHGRTVVLEVDGGLHMEAHTWWHDMARERELVIAGKIVVRCSTQELRHDPSRIVRDLIDLGVPHDRPVERGA